MMTTAKAMTYRAIDAPESPNIDTSNSCMGFSRLCGTSGHGPVSSVYCHGLSFDTQRAARLADCSRIAGFVIAAPVLPKRRISGDGPYPEHGVGRGLTPH
jgi:hypothetical protein